VTNIGGAKVYAAKLATGRVTKEVGQEIPTVIWNDMASPPSPKITKYHGETHKSQPRIKKKEQIGENAQVEMPAHQIGFRKYERLSDACEPYEEFKAASFKP